MTEYIQYQFFLSTADEERIVFHDDKQTSSTPYKERLLPAGLYRVIDGEVFRIIDGIPYLP